MGDLVLSLFPGIGLLDMAFEEEGFCVVRGPDLLWGGDIRSFHPPVGVFDGVIGGPPCQQFSPLANIAKARGQTVAPDLIPEFERVVGEARPAWFLMENVRRAPIPSLPSYIVYDQLLENRAVGGVQRRVRRFSFGTLDGRPLVVPENALYPIDCVGTVVGRGTAWNPRKKRPEPKRTMAAFREACDAQGLPAEYDILPFKVEWKMRVIGEGVPLPMGRAIAKAVKKAMEAG